jgi:hypothetical protein
VIASALETPPPPSRTRLAARQAAAHQNPPLKKNPNNHTNTKVAFGEHLRVVGSLPQLGDWDPAAAPALKWGDGHEWTATLELPHDARAEFKVSRACSWWRMSACAVRVCVCGMCVPRILKPPLN